MSVGAFCGDKPEPILDSIKRWRSSCGAESWVAVDHIKSLIGKAHGRGLPVIYTTGEYRDDNWDAGSWRWKNRRRDEDVDRPKTGWTATRSFRRSRRDRRTSWCCKKKPSGFFGTDLASYLTLLGCDSVVITGTTTSGCVRATAVDAFSLNYRVVLAEEGCFDRSEASHAVSLCDMHAKYADVMKVKDVLAYFDTIPAGQFDLPKGSGQGERRQGRWLPSRRRYRQPR